MSPILKMEKVWLDLCRDLYINATNSILKPKVTLKLLNRVKMATLVGFAKEEIFKVYITTLKMQRFYSVALGQCKKCKTILSIFQPKLHSKTVDCF